MTHGSEGGSDVFEFVVDVEAQFAQSDDESQDGDRGDEHQFSRDNETSVVVQERVEESHECVLWLGVMLMLKRKSTGGAKDR